MLRALQLALLSLSCFDDIIGAIEQEGIKRPKKKVKEAEIAFAP
jgi:hypothetical protein